MKKVLLFLFLFFTIQGYSQQILQPSNEKSYTEYMDKILEDIEVNDKSRITNGILYDRVFPVAKLDTYNDSINQSNYDHFSNHGMNYQKQT
jgi:hypothetical protein